jgi:hypothetical protein
MGAPARTPVPWSSSTLALSLCFTLDDAQSAELLRRRDIQQCADECAAATGGLLPPGTRVVARVDAADGPVNVTTVHKRPANTEWHNNENHLRCEVFYGTGAHANQVGVRCLVELPQLDGVTGLRFTLTLLEALLSVGPSSLSTAREFKRNPPLHYTPGHAVRLLRRLAELVPRLIYSWLLQPAASELQTKIPTTPAGLFAYYRQLAPPLAVCRCYTPTGVNAGEAFKAMIAALSGWATRPPRRRGFYVLINLPPAVVPSIVATPAEVMATEARYAGALVPPGPPPSGAPWALLNHVHVEHIFLNNYGRHSHPSLPAGRFTGFLWDWVGLAAPICGIGCVTINDTFLAWRRGTAADLDSSEALFAASVGLPTQETTQLVR